MWFKQEELTSLCQQNTTMIYAQCLMLLELISLCCVRRQLLNDLCTEVRSSFQERFQNLIFVLLQPSFCSTTAWHDVIQLLCSSLERCRPFCGPFEYQLSNTSTIYRTAIHLRITNYRTLTKCSAYWKVHTLVILGYGTIMRPIYRALRAPQRSLNIFVSFQGKRTTKYV